MVPVRVLPLAAAGALVCLAVTAVFLADSYLVGAVALLAPFAIALAGDLWLSAAVLFTVKTRDYP